MTKIELIKKIAADANVKKVQVTRVISALIDRLADSLKKDGRFALAGLGVFRVSSRIARAARNPRTGESVQVPKRKFVRFRGSTKLKKLI